MEGSMKTLILNGSPRKNGDTVSLIRLLTGQLKGECRVVDVYFAAISPCMDCRFCWKNDGCAIQDEMQEIYAYIQECDHIVIASPVYFSELTGKMLDVCSRLQRFFCARVFRGENPVAKLKKGAVILVGGGDGKMDTAHKTARILLRQMNCAEIHELVASHGTNQKPAICDEQAVRGIECIADFFNHSEK